MSLTPDSKSYLRHVLLKQRRAISWVDRAHAANAAADLFRATRLFQQSEHIACYYATEDEFDCMPIMNAVWEEKKNCYLPVISDQEKNTLHFYHYTPQDVLQLNRYKIPEPVNTQKIVPKKLEVVLLPLVGFDREGNRLGMGAGFYDRTFAFLQQDRSKTIYLMGVSYACQRVDSLPHDTWDVPLDGVITENEVIFFRTFV